MISASGLYYLAELVEEYTVASRKIISTLIILTILIHVLLLIFDQLPWTMVLSGLAAHILHAFIIRDFPYVKFFSIPFIGAVILLFVNHYFAFSYFSSNYHPFSEVMAYFIICMWLVPFALFVSLSANDNVLPTTVNENTSLLHSNNKQDDVVSNYFSKRGKRVGLLQLFNYARESILPTRNKKSF